MMTMRKGSTTTLVAVCIIMTAMLIGKLELTMAQPPPPAGCSERALTACGPAVLSGTPPPRECCRILSEQSPQCICKYLQNPMYQQYAANARKTLMACGVSTTC